MSTMMNDECQVMCSIDKCLCSAVFVRKYIKLDQGQLMLRRGKLKDCLDALWVISAGQKRTEKEMRNEEINRR